MIPLPGKASEGENGGDDYRKGTSRERQKLMGKEFLRKGSSFSVYSFLDLL